MKHFAAVLQISALILASIGALLTFSAGVAILISACFVAVAGLLVEYG